MIIVFVIVLMFIGIAFIINLYSIVNPFLDNLGDIKNYNIAYYGAIGSLERAYLVLKHHQPGFEGSGGWNGNINFGPIVDQKYSGKLSFLTNNKNGTWYEIKSRTNSNGQIPSPGIGNVDKDLSFTGTDASSNYNKLEYLMSEEFILDIDNTTDTGSYYSGNIVISGFNSSAITGTIRLPPIILSGLNYPLYVGGDADGDGIGNDIIVNRTFFGSQGGNVFSILPNISVVYGVTPSVNTNDSAIREDIINNGGTNINFGVNKTPIFGIGNPVRSDLVSGHNIIPNDSSLSGLTFQQIFANTSGLHLKFSLVNAMKNMNDDIYPFLEYKLNFGSQVPDRFFNVTGVGKVGKYEVKVNVKKPIVNTTVSSDFAILF